MTTSPYPRAIRPDELELYGGLLKCEWCNATTELQYDERDGRILVECIPANRDACNERDCDLHAPREDN